jgi:hypothetical protein
MPDENWVHAVIGQVTQLGVLTAKEAAVVQHYIELDESSWEQTGRALGISRQRLCSVLLPSDTEDQNLDSLLSPRGSGWHQGA